MDTSSITEFILGAGINRLPMFGFKQSGKNTFIRNVRCRCKASLFAENELTLYRNHIRTNIVQAVTVMVKAAPEAVKQAQADGDADLNDEEKRKTARAAMKRFADTVRAGEATIDYKVLFEDVQTIWSFSPMQKAFRAKMFNVPKGYEYFFEHRLGALGRPNYVPNKEDIMHIEGSPLEPSGGFEILLELNEKKLVLFDFGSDKYFDWAESKELLDSSPAFMVFVSVGDYDTVSEETKTNVFVDHLRGFWSLSDDPTLEGKHFIVILNKADVLKEKIGKGISPKNVCSAFDDYQGPLELDHVIGYISDLFKPRNDQKGRIVSCYLSYSNNEENLQNLFKIVGNFTDLKGWDDLLNPGKKCIVS